MRILTRSNDFSRDLSLLLLLTPTVAFHPRTFNCRRISSLLTFGGDSDVAETSESLEVSILGRRSCKRFRRFDGKQETLDEASASDPSVVEKVIQCLDLSRRSPSAFNTQPYKVCLVHSVEQKKALSRYCLGPNQSRVLDADCTVVFLADRQVMRTFRRYGQLLATNYGAQPRRSLLQTYFYISMFSSGYPFPRILSAPLSFIVRSCFAVVNFFTRRFYPMPSLANAETWASKQALMVAMTFMLACSSSKLASIPMEGFNGGGIRKVIGAPSRYSVPLIVSVGTPFTNTTSNKSRSANDRYPLEEFVYDDRFGEAFPCSPA